LGERDESSAAAGVEEDLLLDLLDVTLMGLLTELPDEAGGGELEPAKSLVGLYGS
jgi:hypothetical protein